MINPFKKISKKTILIASVLVILIGVPVLAYFYLNEETEDTSAWYDNSWLYRRSITVNNAGGTLTNEDVLITLDTASLISAGKLQSDCDDLRFVDSDDSTSLQYWIEDDCNTSSTKIWTRVPSLTSGGKTIYVYYGNSSAIKGSLNWSGNVYMYADTTCPSGWTAASALNGKFLYGSATFGTTGGASSHSHTNVSCTSTSISTTNIAGSTSSGITSTSTTHTHTGLASTVNSQSVLPSYRDMILCYRNRFTLNSGLISLFSGSTPTGWTRFSALDNYLPQANSSYGTTGGSNTHTHTTTGQTTAGPNASANSISTPLNATGGTITYSGGYKIHKFTSSGTFGANVGGTVQALLVAGGGGGGTDSGGGGGGGGTVYNTSYAITAGNKSITVGGGGGASTNGGNSVFIGLTAYGGGGGGNINANGKAGGSGGGGGGHWGYDPVTYGGSASQGYAGGNSGAGLLAAAGGGGRAGTGYTTTANTTPGHGGAGMGYSITGTTVVYAGGGGGGNVNNPAGNGGLGGGGNGSNVRSQVGYNGTANTGGGGGGGGSIAAGGYGGSGVVIIRYPTPLSLSGTGASGTHTHTVNSVSIDSPSNVPPYMTMLFGKANSTVYVNENNILPSSELPPLGWNRYSALDSKFVMGSSSSGTTGGTATHSHSTTLTTGSPSATVSLYGTGANFADSTHTHSCSTTTNTASNLPPYYSVIYIQRKTSQSISIAEEVTLNTQPNAPTSLLTNGTTNPTGVASATAYFSAIFSDPDTSDTGEYYRIEVNTNNTFTGTTLWDSGKVSMTSTANGARSPNISYNGTAFTPGQTYYWRIKFWDNGSIFNESDWSSTSQFTANESPTAPTSLLTEGTTNPTQVADLTPEFSAIFNDPNTGDTGAYYQIQVNTASNFSGTSMWDSTKTSMTSTAIGARSPDISYAGTALTFNGTTYYWRIKFWDNNNIEGAWSSTVQFTMNTPPTAPTSLLTEGVSNPNKVYDTTPEFSAIFNDPNGSDTGAYYQIEVNTLSDFTGTSMWDSNKTSMTSTANGARSPDISYAGTSLTLNGNIYHWRIRFWDNYDTQGAWSSTASFRMSGPPNPPTALLFDGKTNPSWLSTQTPVLSAIHSDVNGDSATYYEVEINASSDFTGIVKWDSGKQSMTSTSTGSRSPDIKYTGTPLENSGSTFYWRIRFWDTDDNVSPWSSTASFVETLNYTKMNSVGLEGLVIF